MAALTKPRVLLRNGAAGYKHSIPLAAVKVFEGGFVSVLPATGHAGPSVAATAAQILHGVALETVDNTAGAAGSVNIEIIDGEFIVPFTGTAPKVGDKVFVADDSTVTLTAATSARNAAVVTEVPSASPNALSKIPAGFCAIRITSALGA